MMLMATDPCWMPTKKERPQGGVWASRDKQPVLQHSGNERHSTAKSSRHIPNILAAGGQLRGEPLQGPGKAESAHLPVHPPKQMRCNQEHLSTAPSSSHPTTPLIPLLLQSPEPAGCPGFNPTGSIIPIISLHFQSTSLHFQSTDLGAVHKSLHPESKAIYCFISSHLHFSNPWKQGRGLEHMGCPGGVCAEDGGLGLLS